MFKLIDVLFNTMSSRLEVVFLGEEMIVVYKDYVFVRKKKYDVGHLQRVPLFDPSKGYLLLEFKENSDLDNYFIVTSKNSFFRINTVDHGGIIQEVISFHTHSDNRSEGDYFTRLQVWAEESTPLIEEDGIWF